MPDKLFFMKLIIFLSFFLLLFSSCVTLNKAVNKIMQEDKFTPEQLNLLAVKNEILFPYREHFSEGVVKTDSTDFNSYKKDIERQVREASNDIDKLSSIINSKEQDNEVLRQLLYDAQHKYDILKAKEETIKAIPCPTQTKTDTSFRELSSKYQVIQSKLDNANIEVAKLTVENVSIKTSNEKLNNDISEANKIKRKSMLIAFLIGIGFSMLITLFLKLKKII